MHDFELISNILCPYTQRAAIQLAEKGLEPRRTYIDLVDKPDWSKAEVRLMAAIVAAHVRKPAARRRQSVPSSTCQGRIGGRCLADRVRRQKLA